MLSPNTGEYGANGTGLKYDIIVSPGSNPDIIKMKYTGAEKVEIKNGKLLLSAFTGNLEERIPKIYQEINGMEVSVDGGYVMYYQGKDSLDGTIVGIKVKDYNHSYPLIVDPWWITYCGGTSHFDQGYSIAIDTAGNTLLTGSTRSTNFPVSLGAFQTSLIGAQNVFVIKFDPNGNRLWATYYGGTGGGDIGYGIAADINNNVVVTGTTNSTDFPVSAGAFQTIYGGGTSDAFAIEFDPNGNRLWGTFCGGGSQDVAYAIATDYLGNIVITGGTLSTNFPVSAGAYQTGLGGPDGNAFVVKFAPNGNQLWGTYFGGNAVYIGFGGPQGGDQGFGIGTDSYGNIAFAGGDASTNFPISAGCFQSSQGFGFVAELDPNGNRRWATYFGAPGIGSIYPNGITSCAVDKSNNVVIGGMDKNGTGITTTPGVFQPTLKVGNGFAAKFNSSGNRIWTTWLQIGNDEYGMMSLAVDENNNVYTLQEPDPANGHASTSCSFQSVPSHEEEIYLIKLDSNAHFACSTYMGGTRYDSRSGMPGTGIAERNGRMAFADVTEGGIPVTPGAFQTVDPGGSFAPAIFNICSFGCGDTTTPVLNLPTITITTPDSCLGYTNFTAHGSAPCDSTGAIYLWSFPGGTPASATGPIISSVLYTSPGTYTVKLKYIACAIDSLTQTFTILSGFHDSLAVLNPSSCHQLGQATAYPGNGASPYTFKWSNGATTQSDTGLAPGSYTCVVTAANGCVDTTTFTIKSSINPPFITKPKGDTGYCTGGSVPLSVAAGSSFTWSPSTGLSCTSCPNPIASPTATTVYTVTGIDSVGCPDSAKIRVNVDPPPVFIMKTLSVGCGETYLEANSAWEYPSWTWTWAPDTNLFLIAPWEIYEEPLTQTTYTITANNGYCTYSDTFTVAPFSLTFPLSAKALPDSICQGAIISIGAAISPATAWKWSPITGIACPTCQATTVNTALLTFTGNTYTIALAAKDSVGCIAHDTLTIYLRSYHITEPAATICKGATDTLYAPTSPTYKWSTGATTSSIGVTPLATTSYYVIADSSGCLDSLFYTVIVDTAASKAVYQTHSICKGNSITLTVSNGKTFQWSNGATTTSITVAPADTTTYYAVVHYTGGCWDTVYQTIDIVPLANLAINGALQKCKGIKDTLTVTGGATYKWSNGSTSSTYYTGPINADSTITVIAYNSLGCPDTFRFNITLAPFSVSVTSPTEICAGDCITLQALPEGNIYKWNNGATTDTTTVCPDSTTVYNVKISNSAGCEADKSTTVNIYAPSLFACCDTTITMGDTAKLSASSSTGYKWLPPTGLNCDTCSSVIATPTVTTTYTVTGTDSHGCPGSRVITVIVEIPCANFIVPNVFTPNAGGPGGRNNVFYIQTEDMTGWSCIIYDRWGKEMFKTSDPAVFWDGNTESGGKAPDGVYYYIISGTCQNNTYRKDGFVQLIR